MEGKKEEKKRKGRKINIIDVYIYIYIGTAYIRPQIKGCRYCMDTRRIVHRTCAV